MPRNRCFHPKWFIDATSSVTQWHLFPQTRRTSAARGNYRCPHGQVSINITSPKRMTSLSALDSLPRLPYGGLAMRSPRHCRPREKPPEVNERTLAEASQCFARRPEVLVAYLFGSHARRKAPPISDVDVAVTSRNSRVTSRRGSIASPEVGWPRDVQESQRDSRICVPQKARLPLALPPALRLWLPSRPPCDSCLPAAPARRAGGQQAGASFGWR